MALFFGCGWQVTGGRGRRDYGLWNADLGIGIALRFVGNLAPGFWSLTTRLGYRYALFMHIHADIGWIGILCLGL